MNTETHIERYLEQLCQQGCDKVYEHIDALQAGRQLSEIGPLSPDERQFLLVELQSIMAIYESGSR